VRFEAGGFLRERAEFHRIVLRYSVRARAPFL